MKKRLVPAALALALIATTVRVPAATAAGLSPLEREELETSYARVTSQYYKKVDSQAYLDGARTGLVAYLQKNGVTNPQLPTLKASDDIVANARELDREVSTAVNTYGTRFGSRQLTYEAISGMLGAAHDKYTVFLSPKEYAALNQGLDGREYAGVGIVIGVDETTKYLIADSTLADGPAERAGLQQGDLITAVDGKSTEGLKIEDGSKLLRGNAGTQVRLSVMRDGKALPEPITITRANLHQPSVYYKVLPNGIGYAQLYVFGANTANELNRALAKLESHGVRGYVLDLRNNGGGYLQSAIDVSSKFVATGPIVTVEERAGTSTQFDAENVAVAPKPLAVLVNKNTASASEITSGAIQDNGVGVIVGTRTYGKGLVQTIFPLRDGSAVKITTARYTPPSGKDINQIGIQPDIAVEENANARPGDPQRDDQLKAAITYLQGKIAQNSGGPLPAGTTTATAR